MTETKMKGKRIIISGDIDLSKFSGDTGRTLAFATELHRRGYLVLIIVPTPRLDKWMIDIEGLEIQFSKIGFNNKSIINMFWRRFHLIRKVARLKRSDDILVIETSVMGGYFAFFGLTKYILDVHGIAHDEVDFANIPFFVSKKMFKKFIYTLERKGIEKADALVLVSDKMKQYVSNEFEVNGKRIGIVENGYFSSRVNEILTEGLEEIEGSVTFVGYFAKWANIEKIIRVAELVRNNDKITIHLIGNGPDDYMRILKGQMEARHLTNITFHGRLPLMDAYRFICRSQIMILPFPRSLCTEVACPIKLLEYLAFGKPTVMDSFGDLSRIMAERGAAIVCDPDDDVAFANGIVRLIEDDQLRMEMSSNAKILSESYSWELLAKKFVDIIEHISG